ncbi:hypothetical protein Salat_2769700 [Sesamum alatum]|uniref:Uncharacterized protein n=1 Tax=Sesamum alatum TaxID=300844 RepID=A0AAE2C9D1_9LAMI|nr:hypothetical protein Salat_2769700 [Sesamum alatum]
MSIDGKQRRKKTIGRRLFFIEKKGGEGGGGWWRLALRWCVGSAARACDHWLAGANRALAWASMRRAEPSQTGVTTWVVPSPVKPMRPIGLDFVLASAMSPLQDTL